MIHESIKSKTRRFSVERSLWYLSELGADIEPKGDHMVYAPNPRMVPNFFGAPIKTRKVRGWQDMELALAQYAGTVKWASELTISQHAETWWDVRHGRRLCGRLCGAVLALDDSEVDLTEKRALSLLSTAERARTEAYRVGKRELAKGRQREMWI